MLVFFPKLVKKSESKLLDKRSDKTVDRFNYRLTLFTFTSFIWIYKYFYTNINNINKKVVPIWIAEFITPLGLAHWIMQDESRQVGQGITIATNNFTHQECLFLSNILTTKFGLKTSVIKSGIENKWKISIWKESMPILVNLISSYFIPEMKFKLNNYL